MLKFNHFIICIALTLAVSANAIGLSSPTQLGQARFSFLGALLYDAKLSSDAEQFDWAAGLSLELKYNRAIGKSALIKATMTELSRMEGSKGDHNSIAQQLETCFADVNKGDSFVATSTRNDQVKLFLNGSQSCTLKADNIKKRFLGIWLSKNSRSPKLSKQLRGQ